MQSTRSVFGAFSAGLFACALLNVRAVATPLEPGRQQVTMPGPWPSRAANALSKPATTNAQCVDCHSDIAKEWRESLHAQAYENGAFQRALAIEPLPFCRGCHAPEASPLGSDESSQQALGVACISCHVVDGPILAAPGARPEKAHSILRSPAFGTVDACAKCHEFPFPGETAASGVALMQSTVTEHRASDYAGVSCATCHMPRAANGRRSHRFDVTRNATFLKSALTVKARRGNAGRVEFALTSRGVGHAFPTGDLFRRIHVYAEAIGPEYSVIATADAYLTRTFVATRSPAGLLRQSSTSDTRIAAGAARTQRVTLDLSPLATRYPIQYSITYERVEHPGKIGQPDAVLDGKLELAEGQLPP